MHAFRICFYDIGWVGVNTQWNLTSAGSVITISEGWGLEFPIRKINEPYVIGGVNIVAGNFVFG